MIEVRAAGGVVGRAVAGFDVLNARHPWSHNDHYHGWILRRLPASRRRALEVGCGRGELAARLVTRVGRVDLVDADAEMVRAASSRFAGDPRVLVEQREFAAVVERRYDVITMVAVLHHLDQPAALRHAAALLDDGGRLLIVGLVRLASPIDVCWDIAGALANPIVGLMKHPHRSTDRVPVAPFPVAEPEMSFAQTRELVAQMLPGARLRRRLFFRFTLEWTKPT